MPAPAWMSIAQGPLLVPGFLQVSQNLSFLSDPCRLEGQRGELRNPVVSGFNHKSVQTGSIPWASEKERYLEQGSLEGGSKATSHWLLTESLAHSLGHHPRAPGRINDDQGSCPPPSSPRCSNEVNYKTWSSEGIKTF